MNKVFTSGVPAPGSIAIEPAMDALGVVVALQGELDLATSRELDLRLREIESTNPGRLLIDLSGLEFMDSTGLAVMIRAQQSAQANGHRLAFRPGPPQVQRLFELTGMLDRFTFEAAASTSE
jgi:anti-sigma B factor antagonist